MLHVCIGSKRGIPHMWWQPPKKNNKPSWPSPVEVDDVKGSPNGEWDAWWPWAFPLYAVWDNHLHVLRNSIGSSNWLPFFALEYGYPELQTAPNHWITSNIAWKILRFPFSSMIFPTQNLQILVLGFPSCPKKNLPMTQWYPKKTTYNPYKYRPLLLYSH